MALRTIIKQLMPNLRSYWRCLLLEKSQANMTGIELARFLLQQQGRSKVQVCLSQDEQQNCYVPLFNLVGLSEDVAQSRSVMASAIAAHEVGHALQWEVVEAIGSRLKRSKVLFLMSAWGELLMALPLVIHRLRELYRDNSEFRSMIDSSKQPLFQQSSRRLIGRRALLRSSLFLLLLPVHLLVWIVSIAGFAVFILLTIVCAFLCRLLIFLVEMHASWIALRLLRQYKVLNRQQAKAARKFLVACALTYLRSSAVDRVFA